MNLTLVRHGRTTMNAEGRLLGRLDPPLDPVGEAQAAAAADAVAAMVGDRGDRSVRIVTSPLARTRATAEAIAGGLRGGAEALEIDDRWIELDYGEFDGVPLAEVPAETWGRWRGDIDFCPPGGESLAALGRRVRAACEELAATTATADGGDAGDVVVVSHVSPIKAAVAWALGVGDEVTWRLYLAPGSITRIAVTERGPSLHAYNVVPREHSPG